MSRYVEVLFASPPSVDFPSLVGVQDEGGAAIEIGEWLAPDSDNPFWRFRLGVGELVQALVAGQGEQAQPSRPQSTARPPQPRPIAPSPLADQRAARKAKLAGAAKRSGPAAAPDPAAATDATEPCPACKRNFNPATDELIDCTGCGESKCTARCMTGRNLLDPCKDCAALNADPDEGGFDPSAEGPAHPDQLGAAGAVGARLFNNQFTGKAGEGDDE